MRALDKKDCIILDILQENCRASLTDIAKKVGLSIDSTKKRMQKMIKNKIFHPRIQIRPRNLGFSNIVDVKIRLNNYSKKEVDKFIDYLIKNPRVAEVFSTSGEWSLSFVILSKNAADLGMITSDMNAKFGHLISSKAESTTLQAYKFETYEVKKLLNIN